MNFQDILYPIADALKWTFENLLEPSSHWFNWVCIVFAFMGIFYWLRRQSAYNKKAAQEGTTP
ncbi:MAG: hypothetical protein JNM00_04825 [Flavobacteriales bacterium]|nr:hypothetical protein [Flavobacteriales bacterium]